MKILTRCLRSGRQPQALRPAFRGVHNVEVLRGVALRRLVQQPFAERACARFRPGRRLHLGQDLAHVAVDRVDADSQFGRDLLVGLTGGDQVKDGEFAEREP